MADKITIQMPEFVAEPLLMPFVIELIRGFETKPACGPKETKMDQRKWEWQGQAMDEVEQHGFWSLYSKQIAKGALPAIGLHGLTRAELYDLARRFGCTEVVEPQKCPVCGCVTIHDYEWSGKHQHVCAQCGVSGPRRQTTDESVKAWNRLTFNPADAG